MSARFLSKTNSAVCKLCDTRRHRDQLRQGGGFNNYECLDKAACAAAAKRSSGVERGELRTAYVFQQHGKGRYQ